MRVFDFVKKVFSKKEAEFQKMFEVGDIVWATMPLPLEELEKIDLSHRIRPYLIVHVDAKRGVYQALASTSNVAKKGLSKNSVIVRFGSKEKCSRIMTNTLWELTDDSFTGRFISKIDEKDAIKVTKKLLFQNPSAMDLDFVVMYKNDVCIEVGDLILIDNAMYYVYALENDSYHLLYTYPHNSYRNQKKNYIRVRNYDVRLDKAIMIDIEKPAIIMNTLEQAEIVFVDDERLKYKAWMKMNQKKSAKNQRKIVKENNNVEVCCDKSLEFGDVLQYKNRSYVYLYTDTSKELFYLVDTNNLLNRPFKFCKVVSTSCDYTKCGTLSDQELLSFLRKVRSLLDFLPYQDRKNEIFITCDVYEQEIVRKRV